MYPPQLWLNCARWDGINRARCAFVQTKWLKDVNWAAPARGEPLRGTQATQPPGPHSSPQLLTCGVCGTRLSGSHRLSRRAPQRVQEFDQALTEAKRLSARAKSLIDDYKGAR